MASTGKAVLSDGTALEFEWVCDDAPAYAWVLNDAHHPAGRSPMQQWFEVVGTAGHDRAWDEPQIPPPSVFRRFQTVGPFHYTRATFDPPEAMGPVFAAIGRVLAEHGGSVGFWKGWCEPRIKAACEQLAALPDDAPLGPAADVFEYGLHQTFTSVLTLFASVMPMGMMLDAVGLDGSVIAQSVVQGGSNASQRIDAEIFGLAELARADARVVASISNGSLTDAFAAVRRERAAAAFVEAFDALVAEHASRSVGWDYHQPTWGERPESALALVRAQLNAPASNPDELAARSRAVKEAALAEALAGLPADQHAPFLALAEQAQGYVGVREDRAHWQMVLCGETRLFLLRHGRRLVAEGRLDGPDDVLWLTPPEFEGTSDDLRPLAAARRHEFDRITALTPPQQIGTVSSEHSPPVSDSDTQLRGYGVSRGRVTGTARVMRTPDDGDRLEPGDVLVCPMTSPSWTPLFAIAGAIVTETGDSISHPAITAREYGIPAVLCVTNACGRIGDGSTVTVDGRAGTVTIER